MHLLFQIICIIERVNKLFMHEKLLVRKTKLSSFILGKITFH